MLYRDKISGKKRAYESETTRFLGSKETGRGMRIKNSQHKGKKPA